ncbi:hypothetical protein [Pseudomonas lurida]|uniref:hypothetical protein n=1 Tax=Pseudomonas lurida TaxID=244566 RepID=UPI0011AEC006|nr:hypothetical protein [Pseudomonas lurida]
MATEPNSGADIGSIVGWTFAFVGVACTLWGWRVRGQQQKWLAKKKDIHDSVDRAIKALTEFEDCAMNFWTEKDTKITKHHILALHRRLIVACKQLSELNDNQLPNDYLVDLRKHATYEYDSTKRPISSDSKRVSSIALASGRLLNSSFLTKSWKANPKPR